MRVMKYPRISSTIDSPQILSPFGIMIFENLLQEQFSSMYSIAMTEGKKTLWLESVSELYPSSNCRLSTKLVPTFADGGCHVVSVTSLRPYYRLSRPEPLLFHSSSSSVVLTRLSGLCSRPTTSQKICSAGNRTQTSGSVVRNSDY
jgi:hypothetical protein